MGVVLREESPADLRAYSEISIMFLVDRVLAPAPDLGPSRFREIACSPPYNKDYDTERGSHPTEWPQRFDTSTWGVISAWKESDRVGGVVVVHGDDSVHMLEGRQDLAVIWDIRVAPEHRGAGVGSALLGGAESWARSRDCTELKVETQNINVAACRFYERTGFHVGRVDPDAYPDLPDETQLLWYKAIPARDDPATV